jgi:hypothetical protein
MRYLRLDQRMLVTVVLFGGNYDEPSPGSFYPNSSLASILGGSSLIAAPSNALLSLLNNAPVKRKTYFSFHFEDVWRVNVVRNAWKISHPDAPQARSFYDSSIWETRKLSDDEAVKRLIREGVQNTSAICVLVGAETWVRRWVRYEIARAIIDKKGLLAVHINSICNANGVQQPLGHNPLSYMGFVKSSHHPTSLRDISYTNLARTIGCNIKIILFQWSYLLTYSIRILAA